jgi:hypothetical protein
MGPGVRRDDSWKVGPGHGCVSFPGRDAARSAASLNRERTERRRRSLVRPRLCSAPLRAALRPGNEGVSAHRELQQLDGVEILDAAADALGGVEQHVRLRGERIADHADVAVAECAQDFQQPG